MAMSAVVRLLEPLATREGFASSVLDEVRFLRVNRSHPRVPVVYDPSILIIAQGRKMGYLGDEVYVYDASNYLVLPVPLPFECATEATPAKPLLGVAVRVDPVLVGELLLQMDDQTPVSTAVRGIYSTPLTAELTSATLRLLECLGSPADSRVLGRSIVREIVYRVLCGNQSAAPRAIAARHGNFSQIGKVLRRIHTAYAQPLDVEMLARDAGMSVSTFHATFKAVTSTSPLQYVKSIRLHKARVLMMQSGLNASSAADAVGYESSSQFSREFKRFFGNTPTEETARVRATVEA